MKTNGLANVAVVLVLVFSAILPTAGFVLPTAWSITAQPQHCVHVEQHVQQRRPIGPALHAHRARGRVVGGSCPLQLGTSANEGQDDGAQSDRNIYPNDPGSGEASKGIYGFDEEIIAREAVEAPFRKIRLVAYGVFAAAALALGGISAAGLAGVEEFKELGQNLPNPLIDLGVLGLSFYLWVEEVKTKRSALRLMEKRREEKLRVPNRTARRMAKPKKDNNKSRKSVLSATDNAPPVPKSMNKPDTPTLEKTLQRDEGKQLPTERQAPVEQEDGGKEGGIFDGMRKTLEAVNQQSYYQALALNKDLEDKGVLPRLASVPDPPGVLETAVAGEATISPVSIEEKTDADQRKEGLVVEASADVQEGTAERGVVPTGGSGAGKESSAAGRAKKGKKRRKK